ncbi:DUF5316 domain-containing protein [Ectobacillus sp. JY-23]|uniref:DUF5316 family protein n=1 Tax=Ectobacillus sp. JY-23 TaxID=2933872 RepID=UPI001FF33059|nr:DUF5316 family protein [Ectobacillus sp. JY-23]UOY92519.1 DUF5316 domain-containing protein [Ectobacillus sp. JY-23]
MMSIFTILLGIGIISLLISGVFLGAWVNSDRQRANFHSETKEHRSFRERIAFWSGGIGVVCLGVAGLVYML